MPGIASGHVLVSTTAEEILQAGGNAFDAIIGAAFVSSLAEPALTSLGGGGFLLAKCKDQPAVLYDFFVDTPGKELDKRKIKPHFTPMTVHFPGADQVFNIGHGSIAVPGMLKGLVECQKQLGRMPLTDILYPAVDLAKNGVTLNETQAYVLDLLKPIMTHTAEASALYAPAGNFLTRNDKIINPELARFLESLSRDGLREFYQGEIARNMVSDQRNHHGLLTLKDLATYQVMKRAPLAVSYRRHQMLTNPMPSFGGKLLAHSLKLLGEVRDLPSFGSSQHLNGLATLLSAMENHRDGILADDESDISINEIVKAFGGTTHMSVIDKEGNAASLSSSNGEGSGYLAPGTGIMLNNMLGEDDLHPEGFHNSPPGQRVASMMSPSMLLKDGQVQLVIGSGGSKRIRTALLQVITNVVDFGMNIQEAIDAPRVHWDGEVLQMEDGFEAFDLAQWPINRWDVKDIYFGGVHAVSADRGVGADPRREGSTIYF